MKQYFLTPEIEVVEAIMKFPHARSVNAQSDYYVSWRKGKGSFKQDSPHSFNFRVKNEGWIEQSKKALEELGLL